MLGAFWDSAGRRIADRWMGAAVPALVFWAGALLAWVFAGHGLAGAASRLDHDLATAEIVELLAGFLAVAASTILVAQLSAPTLRILEGYWPRWAGGLRRRLVRRVERIAEADNQAWQRARSRLDSGASPSDDDILELALLESRAHRRPQQGAMLMATRTGNILRSAETRPADKYGLDAVIVWPRLWLVLPEHTRQELNCSRDSLDSAVTSAVWGLLFCCLVPLAWWALPAGLIVAALAVLWWVPRRAEVFADLVDAAYDLHRGGLYEQMRWPLPDSPREERASGRELTAYLWRGSDACHPRFVPRPPQ